MSALQEDNRPENQRPPMQPMEFYFLATARCPYCNHEEKVRINKDKFVYHECNKGNVMGKIPEIVIPQEMVEHLHKEKIINNLTYLEKRYDSKQAYPSLRLKAGKKK